MINLILINMPLHLFVFLDFVERHLWIADLNETRRQVVIHPRILLAMRVHGQLFEVIDGISHEAKLKHEHTVIESANEMVWIYHQAAFEKLNCTR